MEPDKKDAPKEDEQDIKKDDIEEVKETKEEKPESLEESIEDIGDAPADALSMTPEELEEDAKERGIEIADDTGEKKVGPLRRFFRKVNVYLLLFMLLLVIAGIIAFVTYLNSKNANPDPTVANQTLSEDALRQLANTDASVGNTNQTLTIQGNTIIAGQTLARGNLNVAGNLQVGGNVTIPNVTVSGTANLPATQVNSLQVATSASIQGTTTLRDLTASGTAAFSGPVTASQITVSRLIISGTGVLEIANHLSFTGPSPSRSVNSSVLGSGGTISLNGSDTSGSIAINTGNNPSPGCFTTVTFSRAFGGTPRVIISPIGQAAARTDYYVERSNTTFSLCTVNAAPANQAFSFDYFVAGNN